MQDHKSSSTTKVFSLLYKDVRYQRRQLKKKRKEKKNEREKKIKDNKWQSYHGFPGNLTWRRKEKRRKSLVITPTHFSNHTVS